MFTLYFFHTHPGGTTSRDDLTTNQLIIQTECPAETSFENLLGYTETDEAETLTDDLVRKALIDFAKDTDVLGDIHDVTLERVHGDSDVWYAHFTVSRDTTPPNIFTEDLIEEHETTESDLAFEAYHAYRLKAWPVCLDRLYQLAGLARLPAALRHLPDERYYFGPAYQDICAAAASRLKESYIPSTRHQAILGLYVALIHLAHPLAQALADNLYKEAESLLREDELSQLLDAARTELLEAVWRSDGNYQTWEVTAGRVIRVEGESDPADTGPDDMWHVPGVLRDEPCPSPRGTSPAPPDLNTELFFASGYEENGRAWTRSNRPLDDLGLCILEIDRRYNVLEDIASTKYHWRRSRAVATAGEVLSYLLTDIKQASTHYYRNPRYQEVFLTITRTKLAYARKLFALGVKPARPFDDGMEAPAAHLTKPPSIKQMRVMEKLYDGSALLAREGDGYEVFYLLRAASTEPINSATIHSIETSLWLEEVTDLDETTRGRLPTGRNWHAVYKLSNSGRMAYEKETSRHGRGRFQLTPAQRNVIERLEQTGGEIVQPAGDKQHGSLRDPTGREMVVKWRTLMAMKELGLVTAEPNSTKNETIYRLPCQQKRGE